MIEQERKFILKWLPRKLIGIEIKQGYLMFEGNKHLRIRIINGKKAFLTFKTILSHEKRIEFEYEIPLSDAIQMYNSTNLQVRKKRYKMKWLGNQVDIDIFEDGDKIVEIEFENELINIPPFCGKEVTGKRKYSNIEKAKKNKLLI